MFGQVDACSQEGLVKRLIEGGCNTQALTGGFHLRSQAHIRAADFLKGEYRHLDGKVFCLRLQAWRIAQILQLISHDCLGCQGNDGNTGHLADVGNGTAGTGVHLDHVHILAADNELDIDHSHHVKGSGQTAGVLRDGLLGRIADGLCRIYGNTVSGMDTGPFNMLHDSRNHNVLTVADRVHLDLLAHQVLIHQNGMLLGDPVDDSDVFVHILIVDGDLHTLAAQHIGGTHQHRIAQLVGRPDGFTGSVHRLSLGTGNLALLQNFVEKLPVLRRVHILRGGTQDGNSHLHQGLRQLDGRLAAELHHSSVRLLHVDHIFHVLRCQRLKIQLVRNIEVGADGLRIVVDDDGFVTLF